MIRSLLKLVLVVIVLVGLGAFLLADGPPMRRSCRTHRWPPRGRSIRAKPVTRAPRIGEATAKAANQAEDAIKHGAVTAKIKSKMALDDLVKARNIDVETNGTVVTLTGVVGSEAERKRAMELAKETEGVTSVIDHLRVR